MKPLPADVAKAMRSYLHGKAASAPIWPGTWADMLKIDLAAAGIPCRIEGPHGWLCADFHALRLSFITLLECAGLSSKTAQELARHSAIRLTLQRCTHKTLHGPGRRGR